jgi:hypothetical protein
LGNSMLGPQAAANNIARISRRAILLLPPRRLLLYAGIIIISSSSSIRVEPSPTCRSILRPASTPRSKINTWISYDLKIIA